MVAHPRSVLDVSEMLDIKTIFNCGVTCHAIAFADQVGLLENLERESTLSISNIIISGYSRELIDILIDILESAGVVVRNGPNHISRGHNFAHCLARKSLFTWLFHASGAMLINAAKWDSNAGGLMPKRDGALIAATMADLGRRNIDNILFNMNEWREYSCVLDVGCGDASRLQRLVSRFNLQGVGIDVSEEALKEARRRIETSPEAKCIQLVAGNAKYMKDDFPLRKEVDVALLALAAHDFLPPPDAIETLKHWPSVLPKLRTLIVCETVKAEATISLTSSEVPSLGYEYLHALMGIQIETDGGWRAIFESAGWNLISVIPINLPANTNIYVCKLK